VKDFLLNEVKHFPFTKKAQTEASLRESNPSGLQRKFIDIVEENPNVLFVLIAGQLTFPYSPII
jgi:hypothetical protein